jgi:Rab GDP dissociation inhibitor
MQLFIKSKRFVSVLDLFEPIDDGKKDNVFVTRSYDATSHFETVVDDLKDVYKRFSGEELSVDKKMRGTVEEEQKALSE